MAKKTDSTKEQQIVAKKQLLADTVVKKNLAYGLYQFYNSQTNNFTSTAENYEPNARVRTQDQAQLWAMNSPKFLNNFYCDGASHPAISIDIIGRTGTVMGGAPHTFSVSFNAKDATYSADPDKTYRYEINTKWLKDRISYMQLEAEIGKANVSKYEQDLLKLGVSQTEIDYIIDQGVVPDDYSKLKLKYNVGMVKENYFSSSSGFSSLADIHGNVPVRVKDAENLWSKAKAYKGMVWLYYPKNSADAWAWNPPGFSPVDKNLYAFAFHYNPSLVSMDYAGTPDLDITTLTSGQESFNVLGDKTMSTISFDIVLNRVSDLQYYEETNTGKGALTQWAKDHSVYGNNEPSKTEQDRIYKYGTMYDVEYLLATILGFKFKSRLRGTTPDIGFLAGRPVDLHLGDGLRYWGYFSSIGLEHKIFNERMVPTFTVMTVSFNRIPDYAEFEGNK
jgi:hypothetical protein